MDTRIVTLSENTAGQTDVLAEWGLSLLIEADGQNILLDTGASTSATRNADLLGIDLRKQVCREKVPDPPSRYSSCNV